MFAEWTVPMASANRRLNHCSVARRSQRSCAILTGVEGTAVDLVKKTASTLSKGITKHGWNKALHEGFVQGVKSEPLNLSGDVSPAFVDGTVDIAAIDENRLELVLFPSDVLYDGRFANNVWLQEFLKSPPSLCGTMRRWSVQRQRPSWALRKLKCWFCER